MAEEQLGLTFDGPAVDLGRMNVTDLAPSLMAASELLQRSQHRLNPDAEPVRIELSARRVGSFELDLIIATVGFVSQGLLSSPDTLLRLQRMLEAVKGLLRFIKDLGDVGIEATESNDDGQVTVYKNDGNITVINGDVHNLYLDGPTRNSVREVVRPISRSGEYNEVRFQHGDDSVEVTSDDWPAFRAPAPDNVLHEATFPAIVRVISPAFDDKQWRLNDGDRNFWAPINDEDFRSQVQTHDKVFGAGDVLDVLIRVQQIEKDGRLSMKRSIERVLDHRPALRHTQTALETGDGST